jgi:hypothetical protein
MKIFQYCLLVNRNGVVVLTAKGILKILMKNFTIAFVREVYVKQYVNTVVAAFVCVTVPICQIVVSLLSLFYQRVYIRFEIIYCYR